MSPTDSWEEVIESWLNHMKGHPLKASLELGVAQQRKDGRNLVSYPGILSNDKMEAILVFFIFAENKNPTAVAFQLKFVQKNKLYWIPWWFNWGLVTRWVLPLLISSMSSEPGLAQSPVIRKRSTLSNSYTTTTCLDAWYWQYTSCTTRCVYPWLGKYSHILPLFLDGSVSNSYH